MTMRHRAVIARKAELYLFSGTTVDLRVLLEILASEFGVKRVVCEGGGRLMRSLAELDLIDGLFLTIAPVVFGGRLAPTLTGISHQMLPASRDFEIVSQSAAGGECFVEFRRLRARRRA
jgi:riboflavin biosynthesis pyrimidine reductase